MTFDCFIEAGLLVQGRSPPKRIAGVDWNDKARPDFCPATVDLPQAPRWLRDPAPLAETKAHLRSLAVPPDCR